MTKILLIGEARGKTEDEYNHGFTGSSGIELAKMLHEAGLTHNFNLFCLKCKTWSQFPTCHSCQESLYPSPKDMIRYWAEVKDKFDIEITNVFEIHPPNNDLGHIFTPEKNSFMPSFKYNIKRPISYLKPEYQNHLENLWNRIKTTKPNICILLGNTACWAILKQYQIKKLRGTIIESPFLLNKNLATWHPANILRDWPNRVVTLADFKKAKLESEFSEIKRLKRRAVFHATIDEIKNWFKLPAERYTIDIESGYALFTTAELSKMPLKMKYILSSQISMIGFARSKTDCLVVEFMTRNKPNLSYWQTIEEEIEVWKIVKSILENDIPKTFQNGVYDIVRLLYAGIKTRAACDDTMLLHHSLFPEMEKNLGFLGSIYANEIAWKPMYAKGESLKKDE